MNEIINPKPELKQLRIELKNAKDALVITRESELYTPLIENLEQRIAEVAETPKAKLRKLRAELKSVEKNFVETGNPDLSDLINGLKRQISEAAEAIGLRKKKILLLVTNAEREKLKNRAVRAGTTLNRFLITSALKSRPPMSMEDSKVLTDLRFELRRLGTGLNQSARQIDSFRLGIAEPPDGKRVESLVMEIQNLIENISKKI